MRKETNNAFRLFSLILALVLILSLVPATAFRADAAAGDTLYFVPGDQWGSDNAWYAAYFFVGNSYKWAAMADSDGDGYYECTVPSGGFTGVIFCRMSPASTTLSWTNKWNQTADLTLSDSKNCFTMNNSTQWADKATGSWSSYTPAGQGTEPSTTPPTPSTPSGGRDVVIHFRNTALWSAVKFYAWDYDTEEPLAGTWPGTAAPAESGTTNWYTLTLQDVTATLRELAREGSFEDLRGFFLELEILTPGWEAQLKADHPALPWQEQHRALGCYFIERYWLQAVADYDLVGRVKLAVLSCLLIKMLGGDLRTAQLYSKEIENSIDNVEAILDGAYTSPALADIRLLDLLLK